LPGHRATSLPREQPSPGLDYLAASPPRLPVTVLGPHPRARIGPEGPAHGRCGSASTAPGQGRIIAGTGISTRRPSTTPVGLALGPDLPWADEPCPGTLGHPAREFLTRVALLMPAFSLPPPPPQITFGLPRRRDAPLPIPTPAPTPQGGTAWVVCEDDTASAVRLSPATLSARNHLTSELLRTLSRVAASKPTSWLSLRLHILSHLAHAWGP
jgi:hypothetical protein